MMVMAFAIASTTALRCETGSTLPSTATPSFTDESCGTGSAVCEYRESTFESGYQSMCSLPENCAQDQQQTYQWKNVICCNDTDDCSTSGSPVTGPTSGSSHRRSAIHTYLMVLVILVIHLWGRDLVERR